MYMYMCVCVCRFGCTRKYLQSQNLLPDCGLQLSRTLFMKTFLRPQCGLVKGAQAINKIIMLDVASGMQTCNSQKRLRKTIPGNLTNCHVITIKECEVAKCLSEWFGSI